MGTFTITPTIGVTYDSYFIPNANGCATQLTPVGAANNWDCVNDPLTIPDADATYVHSNATNLKYDLYNIPDHTTESDTINYIQVYARTKSHDGPQDADGIFKILVTDDACANIYKSDDINLVSSYNTYNKLWTTNLRTASAWTWGNIDALQFGIECSSPSLSHEVVTIFKPNAAGDVTQLTPRPDVPNWDKVVTWDSGATRVDQCDTDGDPGTVTSGYDLYNLTNHTTEVGVISKIVVWAWVFCFRLTTTKTVIKTGGNEFYDDITPLSDSVWHLQSTEYILNPDTGNAWTWGEIDSLQAGIYLTEPYEPWQCNKCSQVYVQVFHTEYESPQIRTTQVYAKVNYTIDAVPCTMDKPEEIVVTHDQNIKMLNFWSGRRAVYGLSRNKRTMVMRGKLYSETACDTIECVRQIAESGVDVYMLGLGSANYDKTFKIISFGWKKISDKPLAYDWILECEYTT